MLAGLTQSRKFRNLLLAGAGLLWLAGLSVALRATLNYEWRSSEPGLAPKVWPSASKISRVSGLPTIIVMAHPRCACTRATIGELAILMTRLRGRVSAVVVFMRPDGVPDDWERTDLRHSAEQIPGVAVVSDASGTEADLFGALASGQTMLYDTRGKLLFSGGITVSRGHSGDNAGRSAIVSLVTTGESDVEKTPVYGCYLHKMDSGVKDGGGPWKPE